MTNYFFLTCSDMEDIHGHTVEAKRIAEHRLNLMAWPLYSGTRNRRLLKSGDRCLIYIAGIGECSQSFISDTKVKDIKNWGIKNGNIDHDDVLSTIPEQVISFESVEKFTFPIYIKPILKDLSFTPKNIRRWGAVFQGGCRNIVEADYRLIVGKKDTIINQQIV